MRKLFVCILGVVTMLFGSIGIVACDQLIPNPNPTPEHTEHEWGEWTRIRLTIYYYNVRVYVYAH